MNTPNYVHQPLLEKNIWPIIDSSQEKAKSIPLPELNVAGHVYVGDTVVRNISPEEAKQQNVQSLIGQSQFSVEKMLKIHFGIDS